MAESRTDRQVVLVRHGATEWSENGRHTSVTDLPLLPAGEEAAERLAPALARWTFAEVLSSPRSRARATAALAGFPDAAVEPDLAEWDYGAYEGRTTPQIKEERPDWLLWRDGVPAGETPGESPGAVRKRVERVLARVVGVVDSGGDVLLVAHSHVLRAFAAAWVALPAEGGEHFVLDTATVSVLGFEHGERAIRRWNTPVG